MQFFDYDNDLVTFNTLMEDIEDPTPLVEDDDDEVVIRLEADETTEQTPEPAPAAPPKKGRTAKKTAEAGGDTNQFSGAMVANAVSNAVINNADIRTKVFTSAYWHTNAEPFEFAEIDGRKIINDPSLNAIIEERDDGTVAVNFSRLVYKKTPASFINYLQGVEDWSDLPHKQISPFAKALNAAVTSFLTVVKKYFKDKNTAANTFDKPAKEEPKKDEVQKNPPTEEEQKQQDEVQKAPPAEEEKNEQQPNQEQNGQQQQQQQQEQPQQQPQNQNQNQQQQEPQKQQQQEPQKEQQPQDEDADTPDDNGEVDQRQLYSSILKDFRDNYQQELEADCDDNKGNIDDDGRQAIADQYYEALMEPYNDKADDDTKTRVMKVVKHTVVKNTTDPNAANKDTNTTDNPDDDNMDWSGDTDKKKDNGDDDLDDDDDDEKKEKTPTKDPAKDKGYGNWFKNTMQNWGDEGVTNKTLYQHPVLKGPSAAKEASRQAREAKDAELKKKYPNMGQFRRNMNNWK
jgi:flagellar biosynthesis GTPase FlhF